MSFLRHCLAFLLALCLSGTALADSLLVAGGAGYKRPIAELATAFEKKTGIRLEQIYGHMGAVVAQAKQGEVAIVFGDRSFLNKVDGLDFAAFLPLGDGRLVVGWPKGGKLASVADLAEPRFARIALPDTKSAIYGIAATEFLQKSGLDAKVHDRLRVTATVPQVSAYLISGEVDAGFINLTEALAINDKIGGWLEIDRKQFSPIQIVAAVVKGHEGKAAVKALQDFMATAEARAILDKYGL